MFYGWDACSWRVRRHGAVLIPGIYIGDFWSNMDRFWDYFGDKIYISPLRGHSDRNGVVCIYL